MSSTSVRIESLNKENYDTWKMQIEALLIKNDAWNYVNGELKKPTVTEGNAASEAAAKEWTKNDNKAKSDIILAISPSELKQVKGCITSREVWLKLEGIYQSKGPARKATLLKQLTLQRMEDGGDVREHIRKFFDAIDKLSEMEVDINPDLLAIMLLYSLPASFENFRCAIESRDELPSPEVLRIKIIEESDARKNDTRGEAQNAMFVNKNNQKHWNSKRKTTERGFSNTKEEFKFQCHRCRKYGHKAADCRRKAEDSRTFAKKAEEVTMYASFGTTDTHEALSAGNVCHENMWCLDSGATSHLCKDLNRFEDINGTNQGKLNLANYTSASIAAKGTVCFLSNTNGKWKNIRLNNTLHVPDLRTNLLSVRKITESGLKVAFDKDRAIVSDSAGNVKLVASRVDGLYYVREHLASNECKFVSKPNKASRESSGTLRSWHRRLGHLNVKYISEAIRSGSIQGLTLEHFDTTFECDICICGKMTRTPFPVKSERKTELLEIIHSDVCGPMKFASNGDARYLVTFIDDSTRWCEVRFIKSKSEVFAAFRDFKNLVENQKGKKIKCLQSDNGGEYNSREFDDYLRKHGIVRRLTVARNPEQNGVAERKNRTLLDTARCLLLQSGLPSCFWAEAVNTANYIRNRCPTSSLNGMTPHEAWFGKKPNVNYFKEFGCRVYCLNREPTRGKFESRCKEGIFIGYSDQSKGYRIWIPDTRKVEVSRDVRFLEGDRGQIESFEDFVPEDRVEAEMENSTSHGTEIQLTNEGIMDGDALVDNEQEEAEGQIEAEQRSPRRGPGRPKLIRTGIRGRPRKLFHEVHENAEIAEENYALVSEVPMKQAMSTSHADEWRRAMAAEVKSILKNDTWKMVRKPKNCEIIGSRVVLRNKYNPDGTIEKRKARIVAQGFSQRPGIHFNQTFAPVARMSSVRLLTAIAAQFGMNIEQLDVTTAYLNGTIEEEIFMTPPKMLKETLETIIETEGRYSEMRIKAERMLKDLQDDNNVCLLQKSLYGLRQAGRSWHLKLNDILKRSGASQSHADPCLYYLGQGEDLVLIAVYVDDILLASRNQNAIRQLKVKLAREVEVKDLGEVKFCLGIEFSRSEGGIAMHQRGYIRDVLNRFGMMECKPVSTPLDSNVKLTKLEETPESEDQNLPYRELVGALMYLAVATRPDIAFAVSHLSQFNDSHGKIHWTAAKRVLRYLKGTMDLGITFKSGSHPLKGFVDADWGNCTYDRRSYTGYIFVLSNGPVSWEARKQRTVALSSTEAEYMSLAEGAKEAVYLRNFLIELGLGELSDVTVFNDNLGAKRLAENPTFHAKSKHIDLKHHFVREALNNGQMKLEHLSTDDMPADMMTKGLPGPKHQKCSRLIGISTILSST